MRSVHMCSSRPDHLAATPSGSCFHTEGVPVHTPGSRLWIKEELVATQHSDQSSELVYDTQKDGYGEIGDVQVRIRAL